jgi:hypothetical protein
LKSYWFLIIVDLVVECGCLESGLVFGDVDVFWGFEHSCLVLHVFGGNYCLDVCFYGLPGSVGKRAAQIGSLSDLWLVVVIQCGLDVVVVFATDVCTLALLFDLLGLMGVFLFLCFVLDLCLLGLFVESGGELRSIFAFDHLFR